MNTIREIQRLNQKELENAIPPEASWHADYRDTAFIYIGGLSFDLSEGDIITIFSQYGEPVWIKLARDKETGKSRGFAWLKYEDQRSTDLAVDNLGGAEVMGRILKVDHTRYQKRDDEDMGDNTRPRGEQDESRRSKRRRTEEPEERGPARPLLPEERELARLIDDHDPEDPMKEYLIQEKRDEVQRAIVRWDKENKKSKPERSHRHRHRSRERDSHRSKHRSKDRALRDRSEDRNGRDRSRTPEHRRRRSRSREKRRSRSRERDSRR